MPTTHVMPNDCQVMPKKPPVRPADTELDRALRIVYEKYGPNLLTFFREAEEQLKREAAEQDHGATRR